MNITKKKAAVISALLIASVVLASFAFSFQSQQSLDTLAVTVQHDIPKQISPGQTQTFSVTGLNGSQPYRFAWAYTLIYENGSDSGPQYAGASQTIAFKLNQTVANVLIAAEVMDAKGRAGFNYVVIEDPAAFTWSSGIYPGAPTYTVFPEGSTFHTKDAWGVSYVANNLASASQYAINVNPARTSNTVIDFRLDASIWTPLTAPINVTSHTELYGHGSRIQAAFNDPLLPNVAMILVTSPSNDFVIDGFRLDGNKDVYNMSGIILNANYPSSNGRVSNNVVQNIRGDSIIISGQNILCENNNVTGSVHCSLGGNSDADIYVTSQWTTKGTTIRHNFVSNSGTSVGAYFVENDCVGVTFEDNYAYNITVGNAYEAVTSNNTKFLNCNADLVHGCGFYLVWSYNTTIAYSTLSNINMSGVKEAASAGYDFSHINMWNVGWQGSDGTIMNGFYLADAGSLSYSQISNWRRYAVDGEDSSGNMTISFVISKNGASGWLLAGAGNTVIGADTRGTPGISNSSTLYGGMNWNGNSWQGAIP